MKILDGKKLADTIIDEIHDKLLKEEKKPKLVVITIGDDKASEVYVRNKQRACERCGILFENKRFSSDTTYSEILSYKNLINASKEVTGILIQLPVNSTDPLVKSRWKELSTLPNYKDVDGFGERSTVQLFEQSREEDSFFTPCTPKGICTLLESIPNFSLKGKHAVIVGRSSIVGKPLALLLLKKDCTVTICHSKTKNLSTITQTADILISAIGKPKYFTGHDIGLGAVVIDVGMNRDENGKLCGDVDTQSCEGIASYITPVPGGVGPMTVASLMENVVKAFYNQKQLYQVIGDLKYSLLRKGKEEELINF